MAVRTFGPNAVDWEQRIDLDRLRRERLSRARSALDRSSLGALLTFDFANIRYLTATHIGTWAMDKLIRFAVLPRGGEPVLWDFGSAARHHQLFTPWLDGDKRARAGIPIDSPTCMTPLRDCSTWAGWRWSSGEALAMSSSAPRDLCRSSVNE